MGKNNKPLEWKEVECQYPELGMCWEVTSHALNRDGYAHITRNGMPKFSVHILNLINPYLHPRQVPLKKISCPVISNP